MKRHVILLLLLIGLSVMPAAQALEVKQLDSKLHTLWLVEDDSLPIIDMTLVFQQAGSVQDPETKQGLSYLMSTMLLKGAGDMDARALSDALDKRAIELDISSGKDTISVSLRTLKEHMAEAIKLLTLILTEPRFDMAELTLAKETLINDLKKQAERPGYMADKLWDAAYFGDHPYARSAYGTPAMITAITRDDLTQQRPRVLTQENALLSVVGDVDEAALIAALETLFQALPVAFEGRTIPDHRPDASGATSSLPMPTPQTTLLFGFEALPINHPDFYPLFVLNHILGGGGFASRLMTEIREKRGLAYGTYSSLHIPSHASYLRGAVSTESKNVDEVLTLIRSMLKDLQNNGVTPAELHQAKAYLTGSFLINRLDTNENIAFYLSFLQRKGLSPDFIEERNRRIMEVSLEEINRLAKIYIQPERLTIAKAGGQISP